MCLQTVDKQLYLSFSSAGARKQVRAVIFATRLNGPFVLCDSEQRLSLINREKQQKFATINDVPVEYTKPATHMCVRRR